jgi:hypothetical protein
MSLDLNADYKKVQDKVSATKSYTEAKKQYNSAKKKAGESFDDKKSDVTQSINKVKEQTKRFEKQIKNQFEQLLDINNTTGGKGSNSIKYVKKLLLQTLKNIEPKILEILNEESLNAVGCDQQQMFNAQNIYIKVSSIDLGGLLKKDPTEPIGKVLYEKDPIQIQQYPFSLNKELYRRIESGQPYSVDNGQLYIGRSGQNLFDIQYVETDNLGQTGPWYKVTLVNRVNNINKVGEFMVDYYKTIKIVDYHNIMASIMESLSGAISIQANVGLVQAEDATKFQLILQRILGLCFDNKTEIDVSGVAKVAELDGVDDAFFEFTEIDLRNIDLKVNNIKNGVVEYENCDNVKLPVNSVAVLNSLENLLYIPDNDLVNAADTLTQSLTDNPEWSGLAISGNINAAVNLNFVKLLTQGLVTAILSPKILLPIFTMLKSLGNTVTDKINSFMDFAKNFKSFVFNLVSKIGGLFVKELFELIKKDIKNLIQQVIMDVAKETKDKRIVIILKLIQLLLIITQFISDWRKCKSVVDELLWLLKVSTSGFNAAGAFSAKGLPLPLLFASQLMEGYSESRAFLGAIEEMQKLGIPTGPMPDGSPNLEVLSKFAQMKAMANEEAENGKVQIAVGPLSITPAGLTVPASAFGKKL